MEERGRERRRQKLVVTRNSEYFLRDDVCVAVRSRATGDWTSEHPALNKRVEGGIRFTGGGSINLHAGVPEIGDYMMFGGSNLLTGRVEEIGRPPPDVGRALWRDITTPQRRAMK